jgi:hypothetical protein
VIFESLTRPSLWMPSLPSATSGLFRALSSFPGFNFGAANAQRHPLQALDLGCSLFPVPCSLLSYCLA